MRLLETATVAFCAAALLAPRLDRGGERWAGVLSIAAAGVLVLHLVNEGARWHLGPLYVVVLALAGMHFWAGRRELGLSATAVAFVLVGIAVALGTLFPVFRLPAPSGRFPVGTMTLHLVDAKRRDPRTDRPDGRRELMVQVWYPAEYGGPASSYRAWDETSFKTRHLGYVSTHAAKSVPVATIPSRHPVVLFSPSAGGRRNHNTVLAEDLASQGFVLVAMDHPFDSDLVVFPDGRTAHAAHGLPDRDNEEALAVRVADARFVLDELERLDRADPDGVLTGRLDLRRCAAVGHSFGGAVAAALCSTDSRVVAGVNFDGKVYGECLTHGYGRPFLYFCEDGSVPTLDEIASAASPRREVLAAELEEFHQLRRATALQHGQWITIKGARHLNYCDSPLYSPLWRVLQAGSIQPERALTITNACVRSFLRRQLCGEDDGLLDGVNRYPEVVIERLTDEGAADVAAASLRRQGD